jgi:hypothetical protein
MGYKPINYIYYIYIHIIYLYIYILYIYCIYIIYTYISPINHGYWSYVHQLNAIPSWAPPWMLMARWDVRSKSGDVFWGFRMNGDFMAGWWFQPPLKNDGVRQWEV